MRRVQFHGIGLQRKVRWALDAAHHLAVSVSGLVLAQPLVTVGAEAVPRRLLCVAQFRHLLRPDGRWVVQRQQHDVVIVAVKTGRHARGARLLCGAARRLGVVDVDRVFERAGRDARGCFYHMGTGDDAVQPTATPVPMISSVPATRIWTV